METYKEQLNRLFDLLGPGAFDAMLFDSERDAIVGVPELRQFVSLVS